MNRLMVNLEALQHNIQVIDDWMRAADASWTLVTKVLCGHTDTMRALQALGVRSIGDSRLGNLQAAERALNEYEAWYLRLPHPTAIPRIVQLADVSLNSEIGTIKALDEEARRQDRIHRVVIMIELGDLREGILPGTLIRFYDQIFNLQNIEVLGIGANLGCLSGSVPNIDQLTQLVLYHELLELKFDRELPLISAGSSVILPLLHDKQVPKGVNHYRIGESVFLGTNLITGETLPGLRSDAMTLEAEIVEIKEKSLIPLGDSSSTVSTFQSLELAELQPGQRGYRAVLTLGHLDTAIEGLRPLNPEFQIAGASSDLMVVNLGEEPVGLCIGDTIKFRLDYGALARAMAGRYIEKVVTPGVGDFSSDLEEGDRIEIPPVIGDNLDEIRA